MTKGKGQVRAATLGLRIWCTESEPAKRNCTVVDIGTTASSKHPEQEWTIQPPIQCVMSAFSPGMKPAVVWSWALATEVENELSYTFIPCMSACRAYGLYLNYSDWLRAGRSGDRIAVGARFSAPVQTGPGAHPASCTMGTGSLPGVKYGRGMLLTTHHLLVLWSWKSRAISLPTLWATPGL
jgi:hypothetical protein